MVGGDNGKRQNLGACSLGRTAAPQLQLSPQENTAGKSNQFSKSSPKGQVCIHQKSYLPHATPWMNTEDIMLSEIRQSEKATRCRIPLYEDPRVARFIDTESRMVGPRGREEGIWGVTG